MPKNQPIDAETLLSTPLPPVRWLIPELLPAGLSLLAGASKAGKSWMCLWLSLQLAKGGQVWGREVKPQTVLYLCLEDTLSRIQTRLFQITEEPVPSRLYFQTGCESIGGGLEMQIQAFLSQHPETTLVVIDTLQKVRTADQNQGMYASDYQDMSVLKELADSRNIAVLLVHHLRKQGASDPFHQISGSNGLMGAADTIWLLQRQRMSATAKLLITGRDMDSRTLHLQSEGCVWQLLEEESSSQQAEKEIPEYLHRVKDFLQQAGTWQGTATQLLEAAGVTGVLPNQLTRKLVEHYYTVLAPCGIQYQTRRTAGARLLSFICDGHDDDDGKKEIPSDAGGVAETSSLPSSSSQALLHSEHGLCVATGHPFAGADTAAHTGSAPNPLAPEEKAV